MKKKSKNFKKLAKKYKFAYLASGCSSVASQGGECTGGTLREGNTGVEGNSAVGAIGGVNSGGVFNL